MGSHKEELDAYLVEHLPSVHAEIQTMTYDQVRIRLNELTGLHLDSMGEVEKDCAEYLRALQG